MKDWQLRKAGRRFKPHRPKKISWGTVEGRVMQGKLPLRCLWTVRGLKRYFQTHHYKTLFLGDVKLARYSGCSESSVYRAKRDLERLHLVQVTHTVGGSTVRNNERVAAATAYEIHPELWELQTRAAELSEHRAERQSVGAMRVAQIRSSSSFTSMRELIASRAGPPGQGDFGTPEAIPFDQ